MKKLTMQYLIEYQTKADAMQLRLDEYYPEMPPQILIREWYRLLDRVNELKAELKKENENEK